MIGWGENIRLALAGLRANKMRSILTLLGIIIGITSVIVIMTLSVGIQRSVADSISGTGAQDMQLMVLSSDELRQQQGGGDAVNVTPYVGDAVAQDEEDEDEEEPEEPASDNGEDETKDHFTPEFVQRLREAFPNEISGIGMTVYNAGGEIQGVNGSVVASFDMTNQDIELVGWSKRQMLAGRSFEQSEIDDQAEVAVVNKELVKQVFGESAAQDPKSVLGQNFEISTWEGEEMTFEVIGVYEDLQTQNLLNPGDLLNRGGSIESSPQFYVPYTLVTELVPEAELSAYSLTVRPAGGINATEFRAKLQRYLDRVRGADHHYGEPDERTGADFYIRGDGAVSDCRAVAAGGRYRGDEHHAGYRHRAHPRNRGAQGSGCNPAFHPGSVPGRGDDCVPDGWFAGCAAGRSHRRGCVEVHRDPGGAADWSGALCAGFLCGDRGVLWVLSGFQGRQAEPHRRLALRIGFSLVEQ